MKARREWYHVLSNQLLMFSRMIPAYVGNRPTLEGETLPCSTHRPLTSVYTRNRCLGVVQGIHWYCVMPVEDINVTLMTLYLYL